MATERWVSQAPRLRHVVPFDGIRGFGVLAVMGGHAFAMGALSLAGVVDMFFVVSASLITTLLLQEHRQTGDVNVKKFYARRLFRLLPGLWAMLAGSAVVGIILKATDNMGTKTLSELAKEMVASFFYVHNLVYPFNDGPWIDHLWTLGVEEQFYLIIGVVALVFIVKGRIKTITWLLIGLVSYIQLSRLFLWPGPFPKLQAAVWNQRPDSLMVGMLVAIASAHLPEEKFDKYRDKVRIAAGVALTLFLITVFFVTGWAAELGSTHQYAPQNFQHFIETGVRPDGFYWIQWGHTAASWTSALVALCLFRIDKWGPNKVFRWKPLVFIGGSLSYPLYLWHIPMQSLVHPFMPEGTPRIVWFVVAVAVPFVAAYPSFRFIETRALAFKDRFAVTASSKPSPTVPGSKSAAEPSRAEPAASEPPSAEPPATGSTGGE